VVEVASTAPRQWVIYGELDDEVVVEGPHLEHCERVPVVAREDVRSALQEQLEEAEGVLRHVSEGGAEGALVAYAEGRVAAIKHTQARLLGSGDRTEQADADE
jgi:hypothetical protein